MTRPQTFRIPNVLSGVDSLTDMARRRLQQKGDLQENNGFWKLRWREDVIGDDGQARRAWSRTVWIGPSTGPDRLTHKQAQRIAWDDYLSKLDQNTRTPQSIMTVQEYVERRFIPEHVALLKRAGQTHYETMLKHVLPVLGPLRLRDVTSEQVQGLLSQMLRSKHQRRDKDGKPVGPLRQYSVQTVLHARNVVSGIFTHAKYRNCYTGENPAAQTRLPEMTRKALHALTAEQAAALMKKLPSPAREMTAIALLTSMNIAEVCGLQWKHVNLTDGWLTVDGEPLPPRTIAVRRQWARGQAGTVKARKRRRNLPIPVALFPLLQRLSRRENWTSPDDPVVVSGAGTPADAHNIAARQLRPAGRALNMPWLAWHVLRRSCATLAEQFGMPMADRVATLGHSQAMMTLHYTQGDLARRRTVMDAMSEAVLGPGLEEMEAEGGVA